MPVKFISNFSNCDGEGHEGQIPLDIINGRNISFGDNNWSFNPEREMYYEAQSNSP